MNDFIKKSLKFLKNNKEIFYVISFIILVISSMLDEIKVTILPTSISYSYEINNNILATLPIIAIIIELLIPYLKAKTFLNRFICSLVKGILNIFRAKLVYISYTFSLGYISVYLFNKSSEIIVSNGFILAKRFWSFDKVSEAIDKKVIKLLYNNNKDVYSYKISIQDKKNFYLSWSNNDNKFMYFDQYAEQFVRQQWRIDNMWMLTRKFEDFLIWAQNNIFMQFLSEHKFIFGLITFSIFSYRAFSIWWNGGWSKLKDYVESFIWEKKLDVEALAKKNAAAIEDAAQIRKFLLDSMEEHNKDLVFLFKIMKTINSFMLASVADHGNFIEYMRNATYQSNLQLRSIQRIFEILMVHTFTGINDINLSNGQSLNLLEFINGMVKVLFGKEHKFGEPIFYLGKDITDLRNINIISEMLDACLAQLKLQISNAGQDPEVALKFFKKK